MKGRAVKEKIFYFLGFIFLGVAIFGLFLKDSSVSTISLALVMLCAYMSGELKRIFRREISHPAKRG